MTNEVLYGFAGLAALLVGCAFYLRHQLKIAEAREAQEAEAKTAINSPVRAPQRSVPLIRIASGSIAMSNDGRGGLIVTVVPRGRPIVLALPSARARRKLNP